MVLPFENPHLPVFQPEKLPLSAWVGISGAAASTGVGQYGSLGLSLLAGLANVRLGYWWDPGPGRGALNGNIQNFVQWRLFDELTGKFPGSDGKRWYLTDGGHFENSGAYELIRRRVGLVILCDNGADPGYEFDDLTTLTRRIRIDFDADLRFIDDVAELDWLLGAGTPLRQAFGAMKDLRSQDRSDGRDKQLGPYAALGRIHYRSAAPDGLPANADTTLLLIKPRICGSEAADLVAYEKTHHPFPQQTMLDQFFDEAQWESYFRLGQIMGDRLFAPSPRSHWSPAMMKSAPSMPPP